MEATVKHHFDRDLDTVFARVTDPDFLRRRAEAQGEKNIVVKVDREAQLVIRIERDVERNLPSFMKKVFSPTNHIIDLQRWTTTGADRWAEWTVEIQEQKRVHLKGRLTLSAAPGGGCDYNETFTAEVNMPLIGGRVAKYVLGETEAAIRRQLEFMKTDLG